MTDGAARIVDQGAKFESLIHKLRISQAKFASDYFSEKTDAGTISRWRHEKSPANLEKFQAAVNQATGGTHRQSVDIAACKIAVFNRDVIPYVREHGSAPDASRCGFPNLEYIGEILAYTNKNNTYHRDVAERYVYIEAYANGEFYVMPLEVYDSQYGFAHARYKTAQQNLDYAGIISYGERFMFILLDHAQKRPPRVAILTGDPMQYLFGGTVSDEPTSNGIYTAQALLIPSEIGLESFQNDGDFVIKSDADRGAVIEELFSYTVVQEVPGTQQRHDKISIVGNRMTELNKKLEKLFIN